MDGFELIQQGAEARLYKGTYLGKPTLAKERFVKTYRNTFLDDHLTKERLKAEARAIVRCKSCGIRTPQIYLADLKRRVIFMEYFEHSIVLKEFIEATSDMEVLKQLGVLIGSTLGTMHENNIIHGDLTSSNMLLINTHNIDKFEDLKDLKLVLIDFGLSHVDTSAEDKGVDLYVLERALLSTHSVAEIIFPHIIEGYKQQFKSKNVCKEVFAKFEDVRARGRKRTMVG